MAPPETTFSTSTQSSADPRRSRVDSLKGSTGRSDSSFIGSAYDPQTPVTNFATVGGWAVSR